MVLLAPFLVYVPFIATFSYWYGAFSPPVRMLVPVVPLLVAPLALGLAHWPGMRVLFALLAALTASLAYLLTITPRLRYSLLRYNVATGESELLAYLSRAWGRDVTGWLPTFITPTAHDYVWALVATFALAALCAGCALAGNLTRLRIAPLERKPQRAPRLRRAE